MADELAHEAEEVLGSAETPFTSSQTTETSTEENTDTETSTTSEGETTEEASTTTESTGELTIPTDAETEGESEETTEETPEEEAEGTAPGDFDVSEVEQEFYANKGELSQETLDALYKQFPKNLVDNYMANARAAFEAAVATTRSEVFGVVGGEAQYGELMKWAKANLEPDEISAFNNVMAGTDISAMKMAVKGLSAQSNLNRTVAPRLITQGKSTGGPEADVYESQAQYVEAISDPRYEKDEAYRSSVRSKLMRTKRSGGYQK